MTKQEGIAMSKSRMEIKMKPEEAYNLIELCLDYDKDMSEYPEKYEMALQIAKEMFQKQMPEQVCGWRWDKDYKYYTTSCDNHGDDAWVGKTGNCHEDGYFFCPSCGKQTSHIE